jgi:ABC-type spermidine/putrescine transport system permease subunit I
MKARWDLLLLPSMLVSLLMLGVSQFVFLKGSLHRDLGMGLLGKSFELHNYAELVNDSYYFDTLKLSVGVSK